MLLAVMIGSNINQELPMSSPRRRMGSVVFGFKVVPVDGPSTHGSLFILIYDSTEYTDKSPGVGVPVCLLLPRHLPVRQ